MDINQKRAELAVKVYLKQYGKLSYNECVMLAEDAMWTLEHMPPEDAAFRKERRSD